MKLRKILVVFGFALVVVGISANSHADPADVDVNDAYWWWGDPAGTSRIVRTDSSISGNISVHLGNESGSAKGLAITVWLVIFNNPAACDGECGEPDLFSAAVMPDVVYGGGNVAGASEKATIGFQYKAGDNNGSIADLFGMPTDGGKSFGLIDSRAAEIHYVVRFHGPAVAAEMPAQIQSYGGGCIYMAPFGYLPPTDPDEVVLGLGDCQDVIFAINSP